jgi:hypothetical protein
MNGSHLSTFQLDPLPSACRPLRDDHAAVFRSWQTPALVMDTDLVLCDANPAYLAVTNRSLEDLVGRYLFDAFPPNPGLVDSDDVETFFGSLQRVIATGEPDHIPVLRYDVPWEGAPGGFVERYWAPSNAPIVDDDGALLGILHAVEDVTGYQDELRAALAFYQAEIQSQGESPEALNIRFSEYVRATATSARTHATIAEEVEQLRSALTSRAVIDQAKGILMVTQHCGPEDAFGLLVRASQSSNVKLRDVAQDLVDRAGRADDEPAAAQRRGDGPPGAERASRDPGRSATNQPASDAELDLH